MAKSSRLPLGALPRSLPLLACSGSLSLPLPLLSSLLCVSPFSILPAPRARTQISEAKSLTVSDKAETDRRPGRGARRDWDCNRDALSAARSGGRRRRADGNQFACSSSFDSAGWKGLKSACVVVFLKGESFSALLLKPSPAHWEAPPPRKGEEEIRGRGKNKKKKKKER